MEGRINMNCIIRTIEKKDQIRIGEPKEIIVDSREWLKKDGEKGKVYSYHMSKERFERPIDLCYEVWVEDESTQQSVKITTLGYYDLVDFNYMDYLSERVVNQAATQLNTSKEQIYQLVKEQLDPLQNKTREEFSYSDEGRAKAEHAQVIKKYNEAKRIFTMQYGFSAVDYDRCYNVFGQLMDGAYLGELNKILEEREVSRSKSKKYRKEYYRSRFNEYFNSSRASTEYGDEDRMILGRFYKVLAKKFHPDANPSTDTSKEMTLLNKLKKEWRI